MTTENMQLIAMLIQGVALIFLVLQVFIMRRNLEDSRKDALAYHERTKKQATVEYAGPKWLDARVRLEAKYGHDIIAEETAENIYMDKELKSQVDQLLGTLEHIAAGVNTGIYDEDILYRMVASSVIDNFNRFKHYIRLRRKRESEEKYIELEAMAVRFMDRKHKKPMVIGDIMHS